MHQVPTNPPGKLCTRLFGEETTNYEYGFLGIPGYLGGKAIADPEVKKKKLNAELANGRLAMMAIIGSSDGLKIRSVVLATFEVPFPIKIKTDKDKETMIHDTRR